MKAIELSEVAALVPLLKSGDPEPLFVTRDGQTIAVIVPAGEDDVDNMLLSINPQFQSILDRSEQRLNSEGGLTSAEVRQRLGLPPANGQ
jgi:antitoxin (DNA-binding transcriptional repressor) of toxin-antitoxin stability system